MKNNVREKQMKMQPLKPEEMSKIHGGGKKPRRPKSPDEAITMI